MGNSKTSFVDAEMVTVSDVATLLQCGERTVHRMIETKTIPAPARIGRLIRWPKARLMQWIAEGCPPSMSEIQETHPAVA